jgi:hypothetical protein
VLAATRDQKYRRDVHRAAVLAVLVSGSARADDLVLAPGEIDASLSIEANLAPSTVGRPLSVAPDLWWGFAPRWTVGLIHSYWSLDRIEAGSSFCLRKSTLGCDGVYHGGGVDVRWLAVSGDVEVAPRLRFLVRDLDPWKPALTVGALARWTAGRFSVTSDPYLQLGLANRDQGNRSAISLPIWFAVQPAAWATLALHTGYDTELVVWRDGWHVPVGAIGVVRPRDDFAIALEVGFTSLLGPQNTTKDRVALLTLTLASTAPARASRGTAAVASPASRD